MKKNGKNNNNGKNSKGKKWGRLFFTLFSVFCLITFVVVIILGGVFISISSSLPSIEKLKKYHPRQATKIYSRDGYLLARVFDENRTWVPIKDIPDNLKNAVIAIEDDRFYQHNGINFRSIARALWQNIQEKEISQGASTITQQLAREVFLTQKQTFARKIKEIILAIQIERQFSKDEILELYLNQIYFGSGAYGVEAAAHTYFGKKTKDLTLAEATIIAGLPQAPSVYSPYANKQMAIRRQNLVILRMVQLKYISDEEGKKALTEKIKLTNDVRSGLTTYKYPYFTTYVLAELLKKYGADRVYRGGLIVYTTLDTELQDQAAKALQDGIDRAKQQKLNCNQGAIVVIEPKTGYIRAMVGGYEFSLKDQFNRAWQAKRQPGSSFKPIVYAAALESGLTPTTVLMDTKIEYKISEKEKWVPLNADHRYWGAITLRMALVWSRNVVAVKLAEHVGLEQVLNYAYKLGIETKLEKNLSLALGSEGVSPLEMTSVYATLANDGIMVKPTTIKLIKDSVTGMVIEDNSFPKQTSVLNQETSFMITDILQDVIKRGTGRQADIGRPAAGKTGTTSSHRDAWFCGYTRDYAVSVWLGNDNYTPMNSIYGGHLPAVIWSNFMKKAMEGKPIVEEKKPTIPPTGLLRILICDKSGLVALPTCPQKHYEIFPRGKEPKMTCYIHLAKPKKEEGPKADELTNPTIPEFKEDDPTHKKTPTKKSTTTTTTTPTEPPPSDLEDRGSRDVPVPKPSSTKKVVPEPTPSPVTPVPKPTTAPVPAPSKSKAVDPEVKDFLKNK